MANNPCFGLMRCCHCGELNAVFWNGNHKEICRVCHKKYMVKRQKLKYIQPYIGRLPKESVNYD